MIPLQLSLTNFMCFRRVELNLAGIHVACLAGENGAGKSALLDALTWALWGQARARRDEELIRLGESEMAVELIFGLGDQTYRVLRQRRGGKRGGALLDFQVQDNGRWRSLAENSLRATDEKLCRVLRLDYDTFLNSAFLRQGRADEFTTRTAAERKRVLGAILGLERWAGYEEQAKERLRLIQSEADGIEARLREIGEELGRQEQYEADFRAAQAALDDLGAALRAAQDAYQQIEAARIELRHVEAQQAELRTRIAQAGRELARLADERAGHERRLAEQEALLARADEIEAGYAAYQAALEQERALSERLRQSVELNERRMAWEARITEARRQLSTERALLAQRVAELESRLPDAHMLAELEKVRAELTHLAQLTESREAARGDLNRINERQAALRARNEALYAEMKSLKERITQLEQAGAECPLCAQPLSDEHRRALQAQLQAEGHSLGDTHRANCQEIKSLAGRARGLEQQIAESDALLRSLPTVQRREAALAECIAQGERAARELDGLRAKLVALDERLAAEDYAPEARAGLAQVLREAEELGYDQAAHEAASLAVAAGRPYAEQYARLGLARAQREEERAAILRLDEAVQRQRQQVTAEEARLAEVEAQIAALRARLTRAAEVEAEFHRMRGAEAAARQRLGAAQQRLEACKGLARQQADKLKRRDELALEKSLHEELRTAFGVKGVPAMIIEAVLPEIENEANRLLSRMTGGRMHVRFDTQRETQAGEVRETLEIKIADELGTREYSLYSGGEAFRVNFAIRIALSRLLARRAGAQLQTLVVDEGFGTQDAQGRERLIEAIHTVQDDFACILVITHIEELRDAFPVRIQVTKTPDGSTVDVV